MGSSDFLDPVFVLIHAVCFLIAFTGRHLMNVNLFLTNILSISTFISLSFRGSYLQISLHVHLDAIYAVLFSSVFQILFWSCSVCRIVFLLILVLSAALICTASYADGKKVSSEGDNYRIDTPQN
jgi:hypothetical protein